MRTRTPDGELLQFETKFDYQEDLRETWLVNLEEDLTPDQYWSWYRFEQN